MPDLDEDPYLVPLTSPKLVRRKAVSNDDPNRAALADPRVKDFLNRIGKSEGADYNTLVGGRRINDLSKHPGIVGLRTSAGPSTAFGKYQIVGTTNRSKLKKYADLDYSPENQDVRAVELLRQTGALEALEKGDTATAIKRASREWASIPGSPLPGRKSAAFKDLGATQDPYLVPLESEQKPVDDDPYLVAIDEQSSAPLPVVRGRSIAPKPKPVRVTRAEAAKAWAAQAPQTTTPSPRALLDFAGTPQGGINEILTRAKDSPEGQARGQIRQRVEQQRNTQRQSGLGRFGPMVGTPQIGLGALDVVNKVMSPVSTLTNLFKSEDDQVREEVDRQYQAQQRSQTPEMIAERKSFGSVSAPVRSATAPAARFGAGMLKSLGGITSGLGIAPNQLSEYLNRRGQVLEEASASPLNEAGEEVQRGLPEKLVSALGDVGFGVAQIIALKKAAPKLSLSQILGAETALRTSNLSTAERADQVAHAVAMGKVLDQHLGRVKSAAVFGVPTAIDTGTALAKGEGTLEDAVLNTAVQAGTGFAMGGGKRNAKQPVPQEATITEPQRFQHLQFGDVKASENQSGVGQGKIRVVDEAGSEHVIQRPNLRGAGNERAIPIKPQVPAEPVPQEIATQRPQAEAVAESASIPLPDVAPSVAGRAQAGAGQGAPESPAPTSIRPRVRLLEGGSRPRVRVLNEPDLITRPPVLQRERATPKSLEKAGLEKGSELLYDVVTNAESLRLAEARIKRDGLERTASDLSQKEKVGAEETATGVLLIRQLQEQGDIKRASEVASDLSRKLTEAGQTVQAASIISRLSPEGVLLAAQRKLPRGKTLTTEQGEALVGSAKEVQAAEAKIATLESQLNEMRGKLEHADSGKPRGAKKIAAKIGTLEDRLIKMEQDARARLVARVESGGVKGSQAGATTVIPDLADFAIIGAAKVGRKGMTAAKWTAEMIAEFPELKPHIRSLYRDSYKLYDDQRKQYAQESRIRGTRRAFPDVAEAELQAKINERLDAQTEARKARAELLRQFNDLNRTTTQRAGRIAMDVLGLSRALSTTADLSAGLRQGKLGLARHPVIWSRAFVKQFQALNSKQYERMVSELETDPDYKYAKRSRLELTTVESAGTSKLAAREEAFMSGLTRKIPGVKQSEQAYGTMLDHLRMGWFKDYAGNLRKLGLDPEKPSDRLAFEQGAALINNATGRGNLGRRLTGASPILNQAFFSPRFWASRVKLISIPLDPRTYTQLEKPARIESLKTLFSFYAVVGTQLALAKASGAQVDVNPDSPDFLKARWGRVHVDLSAGFQNHIRVALRLVKSVYEEKSGQKAKSEPSRIVGQYLRSKEAPNVGLVHDVLLSRKTREGYGTNYRGDPVFLFGKPGSRGFDRAKSSALFQKYTPMISQDALEAYDQMQWKGVGIAVPATFFGEGVKIYEPSKRRQVTIPAASSPR